MSLEPWTLPAMLLIHGLFAVLRRTDTRLGRNIRTTDQGAYDNAVRSQQHKLEETRTYGRQKGYE